ncbi:unnamed protein product [Microthlaspi erraticum]|uniref:F-box domain-containing protein n=1 Tax=Microthlaspi erraticum TaxID=1685480 RepID=A0A6D2LLZ2_9BRAS|nr:unnamed protein product [Microthlaspi erraticum]
MGNEELPHSDRISHLPDDLLVRILSLIPVRNAMSTSLLSKRWKSVWKMMPTLVYDETCRHIGSLRSDHFFGVSLRLHEAPVLKTLILQLVEDSDSIDTLLFPNIRSTLLEITIIFDSYRRRYSPITFPENLNVFKTLLVMKLEGRILLDCDDSPVCFPSLKSLHLTSVEFSCEESLSTLLSACPILEDLYLERLCSVGSFLYTISVPSLQRLFLTKGNAYYGNDDPKASLKVNLSKNVELLKVLTSVERLSLDSYPSMVLHTADSLILNRLLHLELDVCNNFRSNLLVRLLKDYPNLRALKLKRTHPKDMEDQLCLVSEPSYVPECFSFHLETLQWIGYGGTLQENETAVYIFKNARRLKTATISIHSKDTENGLMMVKDLRSMAKASASCQLVIKI